MNFIKISFKSVMMNKTRTLLIMLCFAVGVFSLNIINSVSKKGTEVISHQLEGLGLYGLNISFNEDKTCCFSQSDISALQELQNIDVVMPVTSEFYSVEASGIKESCVLWGVDNNAEKVMNIDIIHGRSINREDVLSGNKSCIVSKSYALKFFGLENAVGRKLTVNIGGKNYEFDICGVTNAGTSDLQKTVSSVIPHFIYVNNTAITDITGQNNVRRLALLPINSEDSKALGKDAKKLMEIKYNGQYEFTIEDVNEQLNKVDTVMDTVSMVLTVIGGVAMIITGISIMSVMILSVNERKREIAIKKSIGAGKLRIIAEFISEAIIISLGGTLIGIIFTLIIILCANVFGIKLWLQIESIIYTVMFSLCIGIIFGAYPSLKAARLKPIEGLKSE